MNKNGIGYIYVLLASFFFALIAVIGKTIINIGINIFDLLILQNASALIIMLVYFSVSDIKKLFLDRTSLKTVMVQGILGSAATTILFYLSLEKLNAGIASMLLFIYPLFVNFYFLATKTKKATIVGNLALLAAFSGCMMAINLFGLDKAKTPLSGIVFGILSSAAYAFYNIYADVKLKDFDPLIITFYTTLAILAVTLVFRPGFFMFDFTFTPALLIYILELAVVSGILPVVLLYKGINIVGADKASIISTSELPITILMSYFILGETMGAVQLIGIQLITCSIILLKYEETIERAFKRLMK